MFFELYWAYIVAGFAIFVGYKYIKNYGFKTDRVVKKKTQEYDEVQTMDQVAEMKENPEDDSEGEHWAPSLENISHIPFKPKLFSPDESLTRSEEYYSYMNKRRSIRLFSSKSVPKEVMHNVIKTAGTAPSGAHTEPWTFVLISSQEIKQKVRQIVEDEEEINYKKRMGLAWTTDLKPFKTNWVKEYLTEAPYIILVFKQMYSIRPDGKKKMHYYNEQSICISAGMLLSAIHYAGLYSLTSTPLNCGPALRALLGRPTSEKLILLLPVGYPHEDCLVPDIKRKPLEDIMIEV